MKVATGQINVLDIDRHIAKEKERFEKYRKLADFYQYKMQELETAFKYLKKSNYHLSRSVKMEFLKYNYSVKTTSSNSIGCGDVQRFIEHKDDTVTMLGIKHTQEGDRKVPKICFELPFTDEVKNRIFGTNINEVIPEINSFVTNIKNLPRGYIPPEERFWKGPNNQKRNRF